MADESTNESIRPEAFQRVKQENEELKAKIANMEPALRDTKFLNDAYDHFAQKEVPDPYRVARQAVKDVTLKGVESDELGGKLDSWLSDIQSVFGQPAAPPEEPAPPAADTAPAPAFARPNPAADGTPPDPGSQAITTHSPEFKQLLANNDQAAIQRLDDQGLILWKTTAGT